MIKAKLQAFLKDTSGAVTLPWIATAGAVVLVGVSATNMMGTSSDALAEDNKSFFEEIDNTGGDSY